MAGLRVCLHRRSPAVLLVNPWASRGILAAGFALSQPAPPLAQSGLAFAFGLVGLKVRSFSVGIPVARSGPNQLGSSSGLQFHGVPNLSLNSDPACVGFRSFSSSRFLGSAQRLGAGGAG